MPNKMSKKSAMNHESRPSTKVQNEPSCDKSPMGKMPMQGMPKDMQDMMQGRRGSMM
jgi:hypothetical protein